MRKLLADWSLGLTSEEREAACDVARYALFVITFMAFGALLMLGFVGVR